MADDRPLRRIRVSGYTSLAEVTLDLNTDVTLLVGGNGAGKSNLVGAFELLGRIVDRQLQTYVMRKGGFGSILHKPTDPAMTPEAVTLEAWNDWAGDLSNGYRAELTPAAGDSCTVTETAFFHDRKYPQPREVLLGTSRESVIESAADGRNGYAYYTRKVVSGCRVFHFDDVSADAPVKTYSDPADNINLLPNASNLAPVLLRLRTEHLEHYDAIVRSIRNVAPFFGDFVLRPEVPGLRLRWSETGLDHVFSADQLSDGTLRFICLAVLLHQPERPHTIVLDEPELGLHPFAIHQLADMMRNAAAGRRLVAATQSVTLLSQFDISELAVLDRTAGGTTITRHDPASFEQWLEDYSLGEIWEKNLLGGRPRSVR